MLSLAARWTTFCLLLPLLPLTAAAEWKQGDPLPDLATFQLEGKLPDNLKGKVILLDFWASWCPPCKASFPVMQTLARDYAARGLVVVAVSVDEKRENMQRFVDAAKPAFAVLRDARQKLVAAADVRAMPTAFLIDRAGRIRFVHPAFDPAKTPQQYAAEIEQLLKEPTP